MGGLTALLDDIAAFAKLAAGSVKKIGGAAVKSSTKASGIIVDDAAVTPAYVHGLAAERELPIIWRITKGSLRNKYLYLLPGILVLVQIGEFLVSGLLLVGGIYLVFEGCAKFYAKHHGGAEWVEEDAIVRQATRTDIVLSAEIMVISAKEVVNEGLFAQAATLIVAAFIMTVVVYGAVAAIVKADDVGIFMVERGGTVRPWIGRRIVESMVHILRLMSVVGTLAMLWVGGHILIEQLHFFGIDGPYVLVGDLVGTLDVAGAASPYVRWGTETALYLLAGFAIGSILWQALNAIRGLIDNRTRSQ